MSISAPFIARPVATSLLMVAIFLIGVVAFPLLPVAPLPAIEFPTITVSAQYPGASPATMASTVAMPLETQFSEIPGVTQLTSTNVIGSSQIAIQFTLSSNIDAQMTKVLEAINAAQGQLPKDLPTQPTVREQNPADPPILILSVQSDSLPITTVDNYAETILEQQLSTIPGVGDVTIGGQQKPAIRVQVDPGRLADMGMTLEDVRTAISSATADNALGSIDGPQRSLTVMDNDQVTRSSNFDKVIVGYNNGAAIRIGDIGQAVRGPQNRELAGWQTHEGKIKRGVLLIVFKQPGANVIKTVDLIKQKLPQLEASIPPSIRVRTVVDRTTMIRSSVSDVEFTLVLAVALVVAVIFFFLRSVRATLIPSMTIPVAIVGTFAAMYAFGFSIDNLSLMGLTVAVGFVIDDAIVVLENIFRHVEEGMDPRDAALKGAGEIGFTIVSISVSLIAVFIPLLLMNGIVGRLFREFAMTVSIAVLVSAFVSLTLTPMLCARFLRPPAAHGRLYRTIEGLFDALLAFYRRTLTIAIRFRFITLMTFFATVALTFVLYLSIPKGFFPVEDTGMIVATTQAAQDISFDAMSTLQQKVNALVAADPAVATFASQIGAGTAGQSGNMGRLYITLKPWGQRPPVMQVISELSRKSQALEGIRLFMQPAQDINVGGRLSQTMYQYTLQDADANELNHWAPKLLAKLRSMKELRDVATDQQIAGTTATLTIDRDQASRFGILPQQIDDVLYDAFGQREVTQYFTQLDSYFVILEVPPNLEGEKHTLDTLYVKGTTGNAVPLSALVKINTVPIAPLAANHQSQFPAVTLSFNLAQGAALGDAVNLINQTERSLGTPPSLLGSFQGTAQAFQTSLAGEPALIGAALVAVYLILGMLYESYILPFTILSTLPSAGVGALLALMLARTDLSVIAMIGIILLIGIVKKNGIMLVDFAIHAERDRGLEPERAITEACLLRFRPILMTTVAAIFTGLPLMLESGAGSELRRPLGLSMVGGLMLSQVLTLYTTPVIYLYLDRLQQRLVSGRKRLPRLAALMHADGLPTRSHSGD
jgi:hydrophobe/amphiphile efflux-1 (HAE1) family protein